MKIRYLLFILLLPQVVLGQEEEEAKKKPSWSVGLPERNTKPDVNTPALTNNTDGESDVKRADFGIDESDMTIGSFQTEIGRLPKNQITDKDSSALRGGDEVDVEADTISESRAPVVEIDSELPAGLGPEITADVETIVSADYTWKVINSDSVKIPKTLFFSEKQVTVKVTINPLGEVVKVRDTNSSTPPSLIYYVNKAMKNWQFEAPEMFGISDEISKVMMIPLEIR